MKICVLGAGVIGVSTAYALARLGHDIVVIDKGSEAASGASHANGAQLSYSYVEPFAGPETLKKLPGYLISCDPAVRLGLSLKPAYLKWGLGFLRNCNRAAAQRNFQARIAMSEASIEALNGFEQDLPGAMKRTGHGKIVIAHTARQGEAMQASKTHESLKKQGLRYISAEECLNVEPALSSLTNPIFGGLYSPNDNALDPITYCKALSRACQDSYNVEFKFNETILKIAQNADSGFRVITNMQRHICDRLVVCLGNDLNPILKPLGVNVPVYPMQGYSLTLPVCEESPSVSITDLKNKIVFANLGTHMRIAGFLDANQNSKKTQDRIDQLLNVAKAQWPNAADYKGPIKRWTHFRPMTPSGVPVVSESQVSGLYLNAGHGSLGYTFAPGSAMKIAGAIGHAHKNTNVM